MELLKIAFRSIFRNTKRSALTISATVIGISLAILGTSWFNGVAKVLEEEGTRMSGHIRITDKKYDIKEKMLDVSSNINYETVKLSAQNIEGLLHSTARIKFGGLVYKGESEKEALGYAIEKSEYDITKFSESMIEGKFLDFNKSGEIIIGEKLKNHLNLKLGDEVTIFTKTQNNSMSAYNYKVIGFYRLDNGKLNQSFYITLKDGWTLLDMEGVITEYILFIKDSSKSRGIVKTSKASTAMKNFLIKDWHDIGINGALSTIIPFVQVIVVTIIAMLAGVGILNTMLMVVVERKREMGILKSLGMENGKITILFTLEGGILGTIGAVTGGILGSAVSYYLSIVGVHIGKSVDGLPSGLKLTTTIYPLLLPQSVFLAVSIAIVVSLLSTLIPVVSGVKHEAAELISNN